MSRYHFALNGSLVTIDFDLVSSARLQLNNAATNSRCELPTTPAAAKSTSGSSGRDCVKRPPAALRQVIWGNANKRWILVQDKVRCIRADD
jgi:hypothetical protein